MNESEKRADRVPGNALKGFLEITHRGDSLNSFDTESIIRELQERRAADVEFTGKPDGVSPEMYAVFQSTLDRHADAFSCLVVQAAADKTIAECDKGETRETLREHPTPDEEETIKWLHRWRDLDEVADMLLDALSNRKENQAIPAEHPRTADGKVIYCGMTVYSNRDQCKAFKVTSVEVYGNTQWRIYLNTFGVSDIMDYWFSTLEAAAASIDNH